MMIDWLSATIKTTGSLSVGYDSGYNIKLGPGGELIRESRSPFDVTDDSEPSNSKAFRVFTPDDHSLYLSGNPVKLLQGHNLFGSSDLNGLYLEAGLFVRHHAGLFPSPESYDACQFSKPRYSRIDLTRSYRFDTHKEAQEYIRFVAGTARTRHGAAQLFGSETAYFGKHSRRWSMKIYDKHAEFLKNGSAWKKNKFSRAIIQQLMPGESELIDWSKGIVRFELCLRGQELDGINKMLGYNASLDWLQEWSAYYNRIQFNENTAMNTQNSLLESTLKPAHVAILELWRSGKDLRTIYPKATFYKYRRAILDVLGVDIASPPTEEISTNNLSSVLDARKWDPEPIESRLVEPRKDIKESYKLI